LRRHRSGIDNSEEYTLEKENDQKMDQKAKDAIEELYALRTHHTKTPM
jgi:hypothetical protein